MLGEPLCNIGFTDGTCQTENGTSTECAIFVDSCEPDAHPSICRNPMTKPYSITNPNCLFSANLGTLLPETKKPQGIKCRPHPARGPHVAVQRHPVPLAGLGMNVHVTGMKDTLAQRWKRVG